MTTPTLDQLCSHFSFQSRCDWAHHLESLTIFATGFSFLDVFCPFLPKTESGIVSSVPVNLPQPSKCYTNKLRNKVKNQAKTKSTLHLINIADWLIHQYNSWPQFLVSDSVLLLLFGPKSLIGNIILISIVGDRGSRNRKSMSLESEKPRFKFWICHSLPVWIQVSYLTSQSLNILICKLEL